MVFTQNTISSGLVYPIMFSKLTKFSKHTLQLWLHLGHHLQDMQRMITVVIPKNAPSPHCTTNKQVGQAVTVKMDPLSKKLLSLKENG